MRVRVTVLDSDDQSLEGFAEAMKRAMESVVNSPLGEPIHWQMVPASMNYSLPIEGSHRDYHYNERGVLIVATYEGND